MEARGDLVTGIDVGPVIEWLMDGARGAPLPQDVLFQLCTRMEACGLPIYRVAVFVTTLHPNVMGRGFFCRRGVDAARDAIGRMKEVNAGRERAGQRPLGFGIGLHLGDVMYGNIGTANRIEFTVVGAAANEAARIESHTKALGVPFLVSEEVVKHLPGEWKSLGRHALRGVGHDIEVFTEPDQ